MAERRAVPGIRPRERAPWGLPIRSRNCLEFLPVPASMEDATRARFWADPAGGGASDVPWIRSRDGFLGALTRGAEVACGFCRCRLLSWTPLQPGSWTDPGRRPAPPVFHVKPLPPSPLPKAPLPPSGRGISPPPSASPRDSVTSPVPRPGADLAAALPRPRARGRAGCRSARSLWDCTPVRLEGAALRRGDRSIGSVRPAGPRRSRRPGPPHPRNSATPGLMPRAPQISPLRFLPGTQPGVSPSARSLWDYVPARSPGMPHETAPHTDDLSQRRRDVDRVRPVRQILARRDAHRPP